MLFDINNITIYTGLCIYKRVNIMVNNNKKRDRFIELAEKRTIKVLKNLELLGNLHNKANYEYSEADYRKILRVIRAATNEVQSLFEGKKQERKKFVLED